MKFECAKCGALCPDEESATAHWIIQHADAVIELLIRQALKDALEIAELNRIWKMRV